MNTFAHLAMAALAAVCVGIPVVASAVVYRDELLPLRDRVLRALAFDPRHAAMDPLAHR